MNAADLEDSRKIMSEYLRNFYEVERQKLLGQPAPPEPIDPQKIAAEARGYLESERKKGNRISTTDAVMHILGKRGHTN